MRTRNILIGILVAVLVIGGASAAVLSEYGFFKTTEMTVQQSVILHNADETGTVSYTIDEPIFAGKRYQSEPFTIENRADIPAYIKFTDNSDGDDVTTRYLGKVDLTSKDPSTWKDTDNMKGTLIYQLNADEFVFDLIATGLEPETEYALIYYKDNVDEGTRFDPKVWGGAGGVIIAKGKSSPVTETHPGGVLIMDKSTEDFSALGRDLPDEGDWNIGDIYDINWEKADYGQEPDLYDMRTGAKIWLVPTNTLGGGSLPIKLWAPTRFLFEADLINYDENGVGETGLRIGANSQFELIIENTFKIDVSGTYTSETTIVPVV